MSLINQPAFKYKFEGIGEIGAATLMAALALNPQTSWMTAGFVGRISWFIGKLIAMGGASLGLVFVNVGTEKISVILDQGGFDGSWESAQRLLAAARDAGKELTDAEKQAIDDPVRAAFRKFGRFGRVRKR